MRSRSPGFLWCVLAFLGCFHGAPAATYYVSPAGSDLLPGSAVLPWKTLQKAADSLSPGDTALVQNGVYTQTDINCSGSKSGGFVTLRNQPGHRPIIDGRGITPTEGGTGLIHIRNRCYVAIHGFEIRNFKTTDPSRVPMGIFVEGSCQQIQIRHCEIHNISNTGGNTKNSGNAFGIAVYGSSISPTTGIVIDNNELHHLKLGSSESLALNGNVVGFQVTNNRVHDNNNIGIVFIGFEETCPLSSLDQARDGVCRGNRIWNISSQGNQAYSAGDFGATGLYCDGSTRIVLEANTIHNSDIGVELSSEHPGKFTSRITLRNNFVYLNRQTGLFLGGYASSGTGGTRDCWISGNTFFGNDTLRWQIGETQIRSRTYNCTLRNNSLIANSQQILVTVPVSSANNVNNRLDDNLYAGPGGAARSIWEWNKKRVTGFNAWQKSSRQDALSIFWPLSE